MSMEASVDFKTARITLVAALAWRVVAELFRRYQARFDLRVLQAHPAISIRGSLVLTSGSPYPWGKPALWLDLGGPSGTYRVERRIDGSVPLHEVSGDFAASMLTRAAAT